MSGLRSSRVQAVAVGQEKTFAIALHCSIAATRSYLYTRVEPTRARDGKAS